MESRTTRLILTACLLVVALPTLAQTVTYCDQYSGPFTDFSLTVPQFDLVDYPLTSVEVLLTVSYSGVLNGENIDDTLDCSYGFHMNLALESNHLNGDPLAMNSEELITGEIPLGGTISEPINGELWNAFPVEWTNLNDFYTDQEMNFTVPATSFGYVAQMFGTGVFNWAFDLNAEVCVTYSYDIAIGVDQVSFDSIKAIYR